MWLPASGRILHRVGVIGDIHGEHEMLDRVLRHFRSIDVDTILSVVAVHGPKNLKSAPSKLRLGGIFSNIVYFRFSASSSSNVRGQSDPRSLDRLRSAKTFPPVWQRAQ